jgi:hypothetical protein
VRGVALVLGVSKSTAWRDHEHEIARKVEAGEDLTLHRGG